MKNYFDILGVHRRSTVEEIKEARRQRARECHPDHGGDGVDMAELNEAVRVLTDPAERGRYVILLGAKGFTCPTCEGSGTYRKQKGFGRVQVNACNGCGGSGVVA